MIQSGLHDIVAVVGFQKVTELDAAEVKDVMSRLGDVMWELPFKARAAHVLGSAQFAEGPKILTRQIYARRPSQAWNVTKAWDIKAGEWGSVLHDNSVPTISETLRTG
jgi:hypothetical protein